MNREENQEEDLENSFIPHFISFYRQGDRRPAAVFPVEHRFPGFGHDSYFLLLRRRLLQRGSVLIHLPKIRCRRGERLQSLGPWNRWLSLQDLSQGWCRGLAPAAEIINSSVVAPALNRRRLDLVHKVDMADEFPCRFSDPQRLEGALPALEGGALFKVAGQKMLSKRLQAHGLGAKGAGQVGIELRPARTEFQVQSETNKQTNIEAEATAEDKVMSAPYLRPVESGNSALQRRQVFLSPPCSRWYSLR